MRRLIRVAPPLALLVAIAVLGVFSVDDSAAELENNVFTSRADRIRMVIPRGWRGTVHPTYPGLLLWVMKTQPPPAEMVLSAEAFTRDLYCSWPIACRAAAETPTGKYACALRTRLQAQRIRVGPTQAGPRENEAAGIPSVYFEFEDGKRFLRQAVAVTSDRAISLVLSAPTLEARSGAVRTFDQALRTLRPLTAAETATGGGDAAIVIVDDSGDAIVTAAPDAAIVVDSTAVLDGATGVTPAFESAPAPKIDPVGPCPK